MLRKLILTTLFCVMFAGTAFSATKEFKIDTKNSSVTWLGKKIVGQHDGVVKLESGKVVFEDETLKGGDFVIDLKSIENKDMAGTEHQAKLEGHLKSDDFFNISKFPVANFKITDVKSIDGSKSDYLIKGDLTVKGLTFPVEIPTTIALAEGRYSADGKVKIDRTKWDIKYNSGKFFDPAALGDKLIYDDIEIGIKLVTTAQ